MIAANSAAKLYFFRLPDISDETSRAITKANSWPMFTAIMRAIRQQQRKGRNPAARAAAAEYQVSTGIRHIARTIGLSGPAARRQCRRLSELGLIHITEDERPCKTDPATGRILENRVGRAVPATITLTVDACRHGRPQTKKHDKPPQEQAADLVVSIATHQITNRERSLPTDFSNRERSLPTSKESSKEFNKEQPSGITDGIGMPMAKDENTAPPPSPQGSVFAAARIAPAAATGQQRYDSQANGQRRQNVNNEGGRVWSDESNARFAYTKAKLERERTNHSQPVAREWLKPIEERLERDPANTEPVSVTYDVDHVRKQIAANEAWKRLTAGEACTA